MALGSDVWVVVYSGGAFCVVVVVHGGVCLWGTLVGSTQAQQCRGSTYTNLRIFLQGHRSHFGLKPKNRFTVAKKPTAT